MHTDFQSCIECLNSGNDTAAEKMINGRPLCQSCWTNEVSRNMPIIHLEDEDNPDEVPSMIRSLVGKRDQLLEQIIELSGKVAALDVSIRAFGGG